MGFPWFLSNMKDFLSPFLLSLARRFSTNGEWKSCSPFVMKIENHNRSVRFLLRSLSRHVQCLILPATSFSACLCCSSQEKKIDKGKSFSAFFLEDFLDAIAKFVETSWSNYEIAKHVSKNLWEDWKSSLLIDLRNKQRSNELIKPNKAIKRFLMANNSFVIKTMINWLDCAISPSSSS